MAELSKDSELAMTVAIDMLTKACHMVAVAKNWWSEPTDTIPTKLLLVVTEVAEAAEVLRDPLANADPTFQSLSKNLKFKVELVDILIRVFDLLGKLDSAETNFSAGAVFVNKFEQNLNRSPRHGKIF